MAAEGLFATFPFTHRAAPEVPVKPPEVPAIQNPLPTDPAHVQALDAVFARDREASQVAGLLGLWTGSILLADLAREHFHLPTDEEFEPRRRNPSLPREE